MPITIDVLVDTNILLRTQFDKSIHITDASRAFVELRRRGERLATTVQNLAEFWNVSTRPESANGHGLTTAETLTRLQYFETCVHNPAGVEPKLHDMEAVACHSRYSWKDGA